MGASKLRPRYAVKGYQNDNLKSWYDGAPGAGPIDRSGRTRPDTRVRWHLSQLCGLAPGSDPASNRPVPGGDDAPHWYRPGPQDGRAVCLSLPGQAGQVDPIVPVLSGLNNLALFGPPWAN